MVVHEWMPTTVRRSQGNVQLTAIKVRLRTPARGAAGEPRSTQDDVLVLLVQQGDALNTW
ncbi:hypothetical protein EAH_00066250, partial [Eimeria acervulina]